MRLSAEQVTFAVGGRPIITNGYLSLSRGEVAGLVGRNGCGKTTLLRILYGSLKAAYAQIMLDGNYITPGARRNVIVMLPQEPFIPGRISVRQATRLLLASEESRNAIEKNELTAPLIDAKVNTLSGGERKYLELLLLLHHPAPFLLLDEPFTGLSPLFRERIADLICDMKAAKGILLTDHDYRNVSLISDRILHIGNGAISPVESEDDLREFGYLPGNRTYLPNDEIQQPLINPSK